MALRKARGTTVVSGIAAVACVAAIAGVSAAPAAAGECPFTTGFPAKHSRWIGRTIRTNLGVINECGAAYTGGPRSRKRHTTTSCQPAGEIQLAIWGTWNYHPFDYITVRAYVEAKHEQKWVGATTTNLKWSWDSRKEKADERLSTAPLLTATLPRNVIRDWFQFSGEHSWPVSGFISGEMVRVHVVIRWKHAASGIRDLERAKFDERIGPYCIAQPDETGGNGGPGITPGAMVPGT